MSEKACEQYDNILWYIAYVLKNPQALQAVMDDYDDAITELENNAGVFDFCKSERLRKLGLRKLFFKNHKYLFVYRIKDEYSVIVEGMYHELQDYENAL